MNIRYPFGTDSRGLVAQVDNTHHIRQMIRQVLFTTPGERVNRPEFGCDLKRLAFSNIGTEFVAATESMIQSSLQKWLGELIHVESLDVTMNENTVTVTVGYVEKLSGLRQKNSFSS